MAAIGKSAERLVWGLAVLRPYGHAMQKCMEMWTDKCIDMCADICTDMSMGVYRRVFRQMRMDRE